MPYANKEQNRDYQLSYHHKHRRAWFVGKSCKICGSTRNLRVFSYTIRPFPHTFWSWNKERREEILKECVALCATHHRLESIRLRKEEQQVTEAYNQLANEEKAPSNQIVVKQGQQIVITITIDVP